MSRRRMRGGEYSLMRYDESAYNTFHAMLSMLLPAIYISCVRQVDSEALSFSHIDSDYAAFPDFMRAC